MKLADFPEVQALSAQDKLQLVDELWLSVAPQLGSMAVSQEEKDILDARWAAFLKDPSSALTFGTISREDAEASSMNGLILLPDVFDDVARAVSVRPLPSTPRRADRRVAGDSYCPRQTEFRPKAFKRKGIEEAD